MPLNLYNSIVLTIPTLGGGGGGVGEDEVDVGKVGDGMDIGGNCGMCYFINWTALLGESPVSSSSLSRAREIKGLFSTPPIPR